MSLPRAPSIRATARQCVLRRKDLTARLLARVGEILDSSDPLLVVGPSGAGKSSLLRAGLMAGVADEKLAGGSHNWPQRLITPTNDPVGSLAANLADLAGIDAIAVRRSLSTRPEDAHSLVDQILASRGTSTGRLLLIVDQLEELFTMVDSPTDRKTFLTALQSLADGQGAVLVLGIRGDFLDQAMAYPLLQRAVDAEPLSVGGMTEAELREVITGTAAAGGVPVPPELTAAVLDDLRDPRLPTGYSSASLPLLSQVLYVMWQSAAGARQGMTLDGYHATGGVGDIVRHTAEQTYELLEEDGRAAARAVFTHLAVATEGRLIRRPATRAALRIAVGSDDGADLVIETFAAQRLLVVLDDGTIEIAHDELLPTLLAVPLEFAVLATLPASIR